jgi:uncharacterized CHY-type Zn-finger protein
MLEKMTRPKPTVHGVEVDPQTRCTHYRSERDIIAIRMACCGEYYACKDCHEALTAHAIQVWPRSEWAEPAVLCGNCGHELTIHEYMDSGYFCPHCHAAFNPGCRNHYHYYFASDNKS